MPNILIADDNKQIVSILREYAQKEGYTVFVANDGEEALQIFDKNTFSIVLLDVMMPKKDGFEVCREIRRSSNIPVIMVTARGEDFERIMGLDIGADDYIVKPFSPGEVMARVRAILRRIERTKENAEKQKKLVHDNLTICLDNFIATINDEVLSLTKKEIELLWVMASNKGMVFTREHLLDTVWGYDYFGDNRTVDSHIKHLRAKLDKYSHPRWNVTTIWGMGYKFEVVADET
jgi:DNA-binding response OmpR family regulator